MNNFPFQSHILEEREGNDAGQENEKPRCEWNFSVSSIISSNTVGTASDTLGVIEFDPSGSLLATGGIARKIRIYNTSILLSSHNEVRHLDNAIACDFYLCTPAKLSSLRWKPGSSHRVIGSGDYDGVVMEYDLETRVPILFERDEHGGRRVWSVDYSPWDPFIGASGADDGTVQLWDPRCDGGDHVAIVQPSTSRSSVCCVEFDPFGTMVAVGCADKKAYGYDVRSMREPVMVLDGHSKTVSYVRFSDHQTVVTAGTDGCLMLWDTHNQRLIRTFKGHVNSKRFVGLSVLKIGGLLCCGSESNEVYVYDRRWGEPIWVHRFEPMGRIGFEPGFVSGVCWRQNGEDSCTLVAGGSDGALQVFKGRNRRLFS